MLLFWVMSFIACKSEHECCTLHCCIFWLSLLRHCHWAYQEQCVSSNAHVLFHCDATHCEEHLWGFACFACFVALLTLLGCVLLCLLGSKTFSGAREQRRSARQDPDHRRARRPFQSCCKVYRQTNLCKNDIRTASLPETRQTMYLITAAVLDGGPCVEVHSLQQ